MNGYRIYEPTGGDCPGGRLGLPPHKVEAIFDAVGEIEFLRCAGEVEGCVDWNAISPYPHSNDWDAAAAAHIDARLAEAEARRALGVEKRRELDEYPAAWRVYRAFPDAENDEHGNWIVRCPHMPRSRHRVYICPDEESVLYAYCHDGDECPGGGRVMAMLGSPDYTEFVALAERGTDDDDDMVVPNLLAVGDRVILTGGEGHGKTTLGRQLAMQVSCGVRPFTLEPIPAKRVLYVDLEVGERYTLAGFKALGRTPERGMLEVLCRPAGLDLSDEGDWEELQGRARGAELIVIGPLYKMTTLDLADDGAAKLVTGRLDVLRETAALWIEAHQPHASNGQGRTLRPYGSSTFLRWPEFGLHLGRDKERNAPLRHWRGPRVPDREWPEKLVRDTAEQKWPWALSDGGKQPWELPNPHGKTKSTYYRNLAKATISDEEVA